MLQAVGGMMMPLAEGSLGPGPMLKPKSWQALAPGGSFGQVFATGDTNIVLKITADVSEAAFAKVGLESQAWPDGVVQYFAVYELPDTDNINLPQLGPRRRAKRAFALWRESITPNSGWQLPALIDAITRKARIECYDRYPAHEATLETIEKFVANLNVAFPRARAIMRRHAQSAPYGAWWSDIPRGEQDAISVDRQVVKVAGALGDVDKMVKAAACSNDKQTHILAEAIGYFMDNGMLLADVRAPNTGTIKRFGEDLLVISDPGLMAPIRPDRLSATMPVLAQGRQRALHWKRYNNNPGLQPGDQLVTANGVICVTGTDPERQAWIFRHEEDEAGTDPFALPFDEVDEALASGEWQ
jgi:hypothetical protein